MSYRVHPLWWPLLAPLAPALAVFLAKKSRAFHQGVRRATLENADKTARAEPLALPELESLKLSVVVEAMAADGFMGDAAVSYLLTTNRGKLHTLKRLEREVDAELAVLQAGQTYEFVASADMSRELRARIGPSS
jgi:hypothetical protein